MKNNVYFKNYFMYPIHPSVPYVPNLPYFKKNRNHHSMYFNFSIYIFELHSFLRNTDLTLKQCRIFAPFIKDLKTSEKRFSLNFLDPIKHVEILCLPPLIFFQDRLERLTTELPRKRDFGDISRFNNTLDIDIFRF